MTRMSRNSDTGTFRHPDSLDLLRAHFKRHPVAEVDELRRSLRASGRTVSRALSRAGYHSSYSHAGRYYTLRGIPNFDNSGLWFFEDVGFSAHGTLRATIEHLLRSAPAGFTHQELEAILRLRAHDTLLDLVKAARISRGVLDGLFVYLDRRPRVAKAQLGRRKKDQESRAAVAPPVLDTAQVIDVLLAVIRAPRTKAVAVAATLRKQGMGVTDAQVEEVFRRYGLGKKTAQSRSRHSPR